MTLGIEADWKAIGEVARCANENEHRAQAYQRQLHLDATKARQVVLFSGMDCLPGQLDLFQTDGEPEREDGTTREIGENQP